MLNLLPQPALEPQPAPYAEAVSRLASIRHALRLVDAGFAAGPEDDVVDGEAIAEAWADAGSARQHCFDRRSEKLVGATAAGVEALLIERQDGREPHAAANLALVEQIRRELEDITGVVLP